jgi:hypothetical protein
MIISKVNIFPYTLILIDLASCVVFLFQGNKAKALYWFAAGLITFSTTIM